MKTIGFISLMLTIWSEAVGLLAQFKPDDIQLSVYFLVGMSTSPNVPYSFNFIKCIQKLKFNSPG